MRSRCGRFACRWSGLTSSPTGPSPSSSRSSWRCATATAASAGAKATFPRDRAARRARGGWAFCREHAAAVVGKDTREAKAIISANVGASKVAATALLTAIEMLEDHPLLTDRSRGATAAAHAVQQLHAGRRSRRRSSAGSRRAFARSRSRSARTPADDLERVTRSSGPSPAAQRCGSMPIAPILKPMRAALPRRSILRASSCSSSRAGPRTGTPTRMSPRVSTVPVMLDEPICELADVKRAVDNSERRASASSS